MKIYDDNDFVNIPEILKHEAFFIFIYGGRGTGKTYGSLQEFIDNQWKFIYLRRLQSQVDIVKKDEFQPFKQLNEDRGWNIKPYAVNKYISAFHDTDINEDGKEIPVGDTKGILTSLSTFSNLRGIDGHDIRIIHLDEFIPELNERPIKDEAGALLTLMRLLTEIESLTESLQLNYCVLQIQIELIIRFSWS